MKGFIVRRLSKGFAFQGSTQMILVGVFLTNFAGAKLINPGDGINS